MSAQVTALQAVLAEDLPPNIALMRLIMHAGTPAEVDAALATAKGEEVAGVEAVRALWATNAAAFDLVKRLLSELDHAAPTADPEAAVRRWSELFDRAVDVDPDASVALYALGDAGLLAAATGDVVAALRTWVPLGPDSVVLEIGCGSGRFLPPLAALAHAVIGADVSAGMVAAAKARCVGLPNVRLVHSDGRDLRFQPDGSVDLVLAADSFPYLVQAGGGLAMDHVTEAARVLRPNGLLAVLNFSYRGDADMDVRDAADFAARAGLVLERAGTRDFLYWDGRSFLFRKPPG